MEAPKPSNEFERLVELSDLDLDYTNLEENLEDLTNLAARIVGTDVSLINLIDSYTQWSVADYGIDQQQIPREDSVCQYTILEEDSLEIKDLSKDERFENKSYVVKEPRLRYYYGIPLKTSAGASIGTLCVLDSESKEISPEDKELLQMIAKQIVRRLEALKKIKKLRAKLEDVDQIKRKVAHDLRNPISGIIGIAQLMEDEIKNERINEVLELVGMIQKGGNTLLELLEEIMEGEDTEEQPGANEFDCGGFCEKLNELYRPQARAKGVELKIWTSEDSDEIIFSKNRLLQIVGNLITNSIKFTKEGGTVDVEVGVTKTYNEPEDNRLEIKVADTGIGMSSEKVEEIMQGTATSEGGTEGEKGYGFGLSLVNHLVNKADGQIEITSEQEKGTKFLIQLPV